jgi:hypothetical protein
MAAQLRWLIAHGDVDADDRPALDHVAAQLERMAAPAPAAEGELAKLWRERQDAIAACDAAPEGLEPEDDPAWHRYVAADEAIRAAQPMTSPGSLSKCGRSRTASRSATGPTTSTSLAASLISSRR